MIYEKQKYISNEINLKTAKPIWKLKKKIQFYPSSWYKVMVILNYQIGTK